MPRLSERARRLIDALNLLWSSRRSAVGLEAVCTAQPTDDEMYAADTARLLAVKARMPAGCPLVGCTACQPSDDDKRDVTQAYWWLRESHPEVWYGEPHERVLDFAIGIARLRRRARERGPEHV